MLRFAAVRSQASSPFGPPLHPGAVQEVPLFGVGSLAHPDTDPTSLSFRGVVSAQFAQPVFVPGVGDTEFAADMWPTGEALDSVLQGAVEYVFADVQSGAVRSPQERFTRLASVPVTAFLVCGKVIVGATASGDPEFGDPVLFVVQAPSVPARGISVSSSAVWPDVERLGPIGFKPPVEPFSCLAGSVAATSRQHRGGVERLEKSRMSYIPDLVYCMAGEDACDAGWVASAPSPHSGQFVRAEPPPDLSYLGSAAAPDSLPDGQHAIILPIMFPLPFGHCIPAGQLWSATIGAAGFVASLHAMSQEAPDPIKDRIAWTTQVHIFGTWLNAVKSAPAKFSVPFIARASIAQSLTVPSPGNAFVTDESIGPFTWLDTCVARRLHLDAIRGTLSTRHVSPWKVFAKRQLEWAQRDGDTPFGKPPAELFACLLYLRPPSATTWRTRYGLQEFLTDESVSPEIREFLPVPVPWQKTTTAIPVVLETREEAEVAESSEQPPTPRTALAQKRLASAQRRSTSGEVTDPAAPFPESLSDPSFATPRTGHGPVRHTLINLFDTPRGAPPGPHQPPSRDPSVASHPHVVSAPQSAASSTGFDAPSFGQSAGLDQLAQSLHAAHSAARRDQTQFHHPATSTIPSFSPPSLRSQSEPFGIRRNLDEAFILDSDGRHVRQRVDACLYLKRDPSSWILDTALRRGPPNFQHFCLFFAELGPSLRGHLVVNHQSIPPAWRLYPATLQLSFLQAFLVPESKGMDAFYALYTQLERQSPSAFGFGLRASLGRAFFEESNFRLFTEARRWLGTPVRDVRQLDDAFTVMNWFLLLPAMSRPRFPPDGLSRDQVVQAVVNMKFLAGTATTQDSLATLGSPLPSRQALWTVGLDHFLQALAQPEVADSWTGPDRRHTQLVFDSLEHLFTSLQCWIQSYSGSFAMIAEASTLESPPASILLLNPATTQRHGAPYLLDTLAAWKDTTISRFGSRHMLEPLLHPSTPLSEFLFDEPAKPTATRRQPDRDPGRPASADYQPAVGGRHNDSRSKGETHKPVPSPEDTHVCTVATRPLVRWSEPAKAQPFGRVLSVLLQLPGVRCPRLRVSNGASTQMRTLCFAYSCRPADHSKSPKGCDGTMGSGRGSGKRKACDRVHVDLADDAWGRAGKDTFAEVMEFLSKPSVAEYLQPTDDFKALMGKE